MVLQHFVILMQLCLWINISILSAGNNVEAKVAHIVGPGTQDAQPETYPFLVYIQKKNEFAVPRLMTTGILIRQSVVLTLAYNFVDSR